MPRILICQHVPYEILGTFHPLLKQHQFRIRYANFSRNPDLKLKMDDYDGLVLLGGPMNVDEVLRYPFLSHEIQLIEEALKKEIPILGICLGAQLIAKCLGAKVSANHQGEIGWKQISLTPEGEDCFLLESFSLQEMLFEWHHDSFTLPRGAKYLASSEDCNHQAFQYGNQTFAFQFHLEVDEAMVGRWLNDPKHVQFLNHSKNHPTREKILEENQLYMGKLQSLSEQTFLRFISLFGPFKKMPMLGSR